jgi:hypothetical protein
MTLNPALGSGQRYDLRESSINAQSAIAPSPQVKATPTAPTLLMAAPIATKLVLTAI